MSTDAAPPDLPELSHLTPSLHRPKVSSWFSSDHWNERIICFNASWFTVPMGTGVCIQVLNNFPYPGRWMYTLGYCFWASTVLKIPSLATATDSGKILTIFLYILFAVLGVLRCIWYPKLTRKIVQDFYQSSYLGAIPVTLDTITVGIVIYYNDREAAIWAALGLFWVAVAMCLVVGGIVVFITSAYSEPPEMTSITGVWLLSFIPFLVTSACGAAIAVYISPLHTMILLIVSYLLWSVGLCMCMVITTIYFWRLTRHSLPVREAIVSCFIPVGPCGMGAYAIQNLSVVLAEYIQSERFVLHRDMLTTTDTIVFDVVAECINWIGVLVALCLTAFGTFFLAMATAAVIVVMPKSFNVGFWAFVFPVGVYANGLCQLANDLNNAFFRGWAAFCVALTLVLWLGCAYGTLYKAVWCGELLFAPGLEGWNERKWLQERDRKESTASDAQSGEHGAQDGRQLENTEQDYMRGTFRFSRKSRPDGTYGLHKANQKRKGADLV